MIWSTKHLKRDGGEFRGHFLRKEEKGYVTVGEVKIKKFLAWILRGGGQQKWRSNKEKSSLKEKKSRFSGLLVSALIIQDHHLIFTWTEKA